MMNKTNPYFENNFMNKYPILFQNKDKSMMETCMCWGIECPPGWYNLLTDLCDKIEFLNEHLVKQFNLQIVADQVKEKYGTLRFYFSVNPYYSENEEQEKLHKYITGIVSDLVNGAELQSMHVCSICGKNIWGDNQVVSKGWIQYYCQDCAKKNNIE